MSTVYRKTAKGQAEIDTRAHRLLPRLRQALILVDGRKPDTELEKLILADPKATLESLERDGFIEIDPVVMHTVAQWQHAGEQGAARGHANHIWGDAGRKTCALLRQKIQVRGTYFSPFKPETVCAMLIAHDQQNVGPTHGVLSR